MKLPTFALRAAWIFALVLLSTNWARAEDSIDQKVEQAAVQARDADDSMHDRGVAALEEIIKELESHPPAKGAGAAHWQFLLGKANLYAEHWAPAATYLDKAIELAPSEAEYHYLSGMAFGVEKKPASEEKEYLKATELSPKVARYWFQLSVLYSGSEKLDEALSALRRAADLDPRDAGTFVNIGSILHQQGKTDDAIAAFKKAAEIKPDYVLAHANIAQIYQLQGKHAEALAELKELLRIRPQDVKAMAKVVQCDEALGKLKERDDDRAAIIKLHATGKVQERFYCRDQFSVGKKKLMAFEYFELKGDRAVRYSFNVLDESGADVQYKISLGSYAFDNELARSRGEIGKDERVFHLDGYYPKGAHATFDFFKNEPSYDQVKKEVIEVIKGSRKPISSTTPGKGKDVEIHIAPPKVEK